MAEPLWSRTPIEESEDFIEDLEAIDNADRQEEEGWPQERQEYW